MKLLTQPIMEQLARNGIKADKDPSFNPSPVVKLFTPDANATWLLVWTDPEDADIAYGLCDLGMGFPEIGSVRLSEIAAVRGRLRLPVERDLHWQARGTLMDYARRAWDAGHIVEDI